MLSLAYGCALLWLIHTSSSFRADDVIYFYEARRTGFLPFVATPIDVHAVPLHRAATYLLGTFGRPDFRIALSVVAVLYAASAFLTYRALEAFSRHPANAAVTAWYATYVHLGSTVLWWSSAAHRLPCIAATSAAVYAYARYRRGHALRWAVTAGLCLLTALGFFEKGVFIVPVLAALELFYRVETPALERRRNWMLLGALAVLTVAYLATWRLIVGRTWAALDFGPRHLLRYATASLGMFLPSLVGRAYDAAWAGAAVVVALALVTIRRAPRTAMLWAFGFALVTTSLLTTGVSFERWRVWGMLLPTFSLRYYPDVMALWVLFIGIALQRALRARLSLTSRARWLVATGTLASLTAVAGLSFATSVRIARELNDDAFRSKLYIDRVVADVTDLEEAGQRLVFIDGKVPVYLNPFGDASARHSVLLRGLGFQVKFSPRRRGVYRIAQNGAVVPAWK